MSSVAAFKRERAEWDRTPPGLYYCASREEHWRGIAADWGRLSNLAENVYVADTCRTAELEALQKSQRFAERLAVAEETNTLFAADS